MKKQLLYIISLILFVHLGYSENTDNILKGLSYKDINSFRCVSFYSNSKIEFSDESDWSTNRIWNRIFEYDILEEGSLSYLVIKKNNFVEKFLILYSEDFLVIYDNSSQLIFNGASKINTECIYFPDTLKASSELIEGNIVYSGSNLKTLELDKCWVENKQDYGIGEYIKFRINGRWFFFFNGYLSGKKNYLYNQNSRVKQLEVTLVQNNVSKFFDIADTPNPQFLLFDTDYSGEVIIKIIDVYKGTKYSDTCINSILLVH